VNSEMSRTTTIDETTPLAQLLARVAAQKTFPGNERD
jgi:hypothetical protein